MEITHGITISDIESKYDKRTMEHKESHEITNNNKDNQTIKRIQIKFEI